MHDKHGSRMPTTVKKPEDHRRAIVNVLRSISAEPDVCELVLDNFDCACKAAKEEGYGNCADQVLTMANSLNAYGDA
jgi:Mg2+ and Co2+ transporter CorA